MIDFKEITDKSRLYNFHSHTQFCDGRDDMEEIVKEAITQRFTDLGFSPHSPIPFVSPCNMDKNDVPAYLNEVNRLRTLYSDKINIYASMEIDFINDWGPAHEFFSQLPLDYKIGSIHFIPSFDNIEEYVDVDGSAENFHKKMCKYFHQDIKSVVESFYTQTLKMIEAGGFDIIGHFDKIGNNANSFAPGIENEAWYAKLVRTTFDAIMDHGYVIEINTKAYEQFGRFFPNERYFEWIKKYNAPIVFNSDVHFSHLINSGRDEAYKKMNAIIIR